MLMIIKNCTIYSVVAGDSIFLPDHDSVHYLIFHSYSYLSYYRLSFITFWGFFFAQFCCQTAEVSSLLGLWASNSDNFFACSVDGIFAGEDCIDGSLGIDY